MGYSIFQFNKKKVQNLMFGENGINVNCGDLGLLNEIVDKFHSLPKYDINNDGKLFVWIDYNTLMNDFPILSNSIGTYRNNCRKLEKLGLIEKVDLAANINGNCKKKTFFRPTEITLGLITTKEDIENELKEKQGLQPVEVAPIQKATTKDIEAPEASAKEEKLTDIEKVVEATKCSTEEAEATLKAAQRKNNPVGAAIDAIKKGYSLTPAAEKETKVNPKSFNNFEPRQYNYDKLESMLLGHEDYNENDIHEVLSNKKTFNGIQIGV